MERIYYISQGKTAEEHLHNIEKVCKGGIILTQLRMKGFSDQEYAQTALKAVDIAHKNGSKLIINDNPKVAYVSNADGVHLGQNDGSIGEARKLLGPKKIIGGTANTVAQCRILLQQGVNYLGVGPFSFTETKQNLSPELGLDGYYKLLAKIQLEQNFPIYAIGGITQNDITSLLNVGVYGVALSSLLSKMTVDEVRALIIKIENK